MPIQCPQRELNRCPILASADETPATQQALDGVGVVGQKLTPQIPQRGCVLALMAHV